tara:strand:+ start:421 stop:648 length:228 start_codon:yes stop_codon:yes gene_type:complete
MKFPQQHITKLTLTILKPIVMGVMFTIGVMVGVMNILLTKFTDIKEDSKTRETSVESKIHPKNTKNRDDFGMIKR